MVAKAEVFVFGFYLNYNFGLISLLISYFVLVCVISVEKLFTYFVSNVIFNNILWHCSYFLFHQMCIVMNTKIYNIGKMGTTIAYSQWIRQVSLLHELNSYVVLDGYVNVNMSCMAGGDPFGYEFFFSLLLTRNLAN